MQNKFYNDLRASLTEALAIAKGEAAPSRSFTYEYPNIKDVRAKTGLSQIQFAHKLNISPKTLRNWEQGIRKPTGPAITLIRLIDKNPQLISMA